ncbi:response regulator transcription factor [Succinispira mobilis]|uniref:response regulator transcription factor n=1 Tax=Succinispira mobilis TaxID=78120 RepID=UPI00036ABF29|nr:response regulator transcription factor [Succinispira mobilis]
MIKVLIVDDEPQIRDILRLYFEKEEFQVFEAVDGAQALLSLQSIAPNLIVLDIMMPVLDGVEVCKQVRKISTVPIIMLTAKSEDDDRIMGLEMGADDYIGKPFNPKEVVARARAILRRVSFADEKMPNNDKVLEFRELKIDLQEYQVIAFGKQLALTAKEMELLWFLAKHAGRVYSREQLLESIWGYSYYGDTRTVDTHIKRLRSKLDIQEGSDWDIKTVWGVGYKFEVLK